MFEVFATIPETMGPADIPAYAQRVEAIGYDGMAVPDAAHDGLLMACQALYATKHLRVTTSILVAFPRSPMNVALAAWDLQRISNGRFEMGLGTQIQKNIEDRYSARWPKPPVPGMREYIQSLRAIFHSFQTGEQLDFRGDHYQFTRLQPFFNPGPIDHPHIPLQMGAVGPKSLRSSGRVSDGLHIHPTNASPGYLREVLRPAVAGGAEKAGRDLSDIQMYLAGMVACGPSETVVAERRERFRETLAFVFSTPAYRRSLEFHGWEAVGETLQTLVREQRWAEMPAQIDDQILDTFVPSATYDNIAGEFERRYAGLVDRLALPVPDDPSEDEAVSRAIESMRT